MTTEIQDQPSAQAEAFAHSKNTGHKVTMLLAMAGDGFWECDERGCDAGSETSAVKA